MHYGKEQLRFVYSLLKNEITDYFSPWGLDKTSNFMSSMFKKDTAKQSIRTDLKVIKQKCIDAMQQLDTVDAYKMMKDFVSIKNLITIVHASVSLYPEELKSSRLPGLITGMRSHLDLLILIPDEEFSAIPDTYLLTIDINSYSMLGNLGLFEVSQDVMIRAQDYTYGVNGRFYREMIEPLLHRILGRKPTSINYLREDQLQELKDEYLKQNQIIMYKR